MGAHHVGDASAKGVSGDRRPRQAGPGDVVAPLLRTFETNVPAYIVRPVESKGDGGARP